MKLTGAQIIIEVLLEQGVECVFGYPGGSVLNIYDAIYEYRDRLTHYLTAHEQGASHAADGYARATGKTGVVIATSGPGATNLVTGIATAYMDSIPMVAITGNVGTGLIGKDSFQEVYIAGITMPITKHNFVVRSVEDLAHTLRESFKIASSGRQGPVLVDIPKDVTAALCEFEREPAFVEQKYCVVGNKQLEEIAELINNCQRPVMYFGGGVISSGGSEAVAELINRGDIPSCHSIMGTGVLGFDEPLSLGMVGMHGNVIANKAIQDCDLLLAVGTRFSDRVALNTAKFAPKAKIVHIDIDPSEINKNVSIDYSIVGDVKMVLDRMLPMVQQQSHPEWLATIDAWKARDYVPLDSKTTLRPHQIMGSISAIAGQDAVFVTDVGQHQMWAAQFCKRTKPRSFLTSGGLGTMGFGYGAAIGAKVGVGDRPVVHITGDGSFHMNLNETPTVVTYNIPVITVIINNSVLGMVRQWQTTFYDKRYSFTSPGRKTDFVKLAEGFGLKAYRAHNVEELDAALKAAVAANAPVWIECIVDKDEKVLPMIPAGGSVDDIIIE